MEGRDIMDLWVFDNDGTLYNDFGAGEKFMKILYQYVHRLLNIPVDQVPSEVVRLKEKWRTEFSILALMKEYGIDFLEIVDNTYLKIKLEECNIATPDTSRLNVLNSIGSLKVVFTNNPSVFARYVLSYVGLAACFSDFIGMEETGFWEKPNPQAYKIVEERHRGFERIIFCDDSLKNLETAHKLGWTTVWYKPPGMEIKGGQNHFVISSFEELKKLL
jgi:HAD superfamily hydrolase (TIGR01509 family)